MIWEPVSPEDALCLARQLKRAPRHAAGIVRRCALGFPAVTVNDPLPRAAEDAVFFPTLFWLSCPAANKALGRLEDQGWIAKLQDRAGRDAGFKEALFAAHASYVALRRARATPADLAQAASQHPRVPAELDRRGIGGVLDWGTIKCLHMHYAHFLATGDNPVGAWVDARWNLEQEGARCPGCPGKTKDHAGVAK